jgi:hypothetical protein
VRRAGVATDQKTGVRGVEASGLVVQAEAVRAEPVKPGSSDTVERLYEHFLEVDHGYL